MEEEGGRKKKKRKKRTNVNSKFDPPFSLSVS